MSDQNWTNERYVKTYEEAASLKKSLQLSEKAATMQFKIKRCGEEKSQYIVKSRIDPTLVNAVKEVEQQVAATKDKTSKKKLTKK